MSHESPTTAQPDSLPWYLKALIVLAVLVVVYVVGVDLLAFASYF
jgi:type III secretory pathway component EscS